ncbi:tetratricopeptide repeat protein [Dokdonella sp.]|uniref:tetratricopeptide repeat protein n=1 Tax=Dokdonella sp. TaxID=2291710 RepID=UPI002F418C33
MLKEAIDQHRQGRFDEAERGYRARLAEQPDDVEALHLLGMLRYQLGDTPEGSALLARAHALAPDDATIELTLASMDFREGDHEAARRRFHAALALDPNLAGAHAGLGQLALMRGEQAVAEQHFRTALRNGEEPHALAGLGGLLLERGELDAALRHLGRAADLAPNDAMIQLMLGQAFARRDTPAFAEQAFRNALRLKPDLHQARPWLGALLLKAGRRAEADAQYRELLGVPGFEIAAQVGMADVARADGRYDDAVASYRAALSAEPAQPMPARALAWCLTRLGRIDEAIQAYDACIAISPDEDVQAARADLLSLAGRLPQAALVWKELLDRNPADLLARSRLAMAAEYLGELEAAEAHAGIVLAAREEPEMRLVRARARLREGDADGARAMLDALDRQDLTEGQARLRWNYLGRLHDRAGEAVEAVRCFAEAQRGSPIAVPALADPNPQLDVALAEPAQAPWAHAPVLLLGTPGSGVERVAALLADQPGLTVLRDRIGPTARADDFSQPRFQHYCGELDAAARDALRERWLAPLHAAGIAMDRPIVDWLPRWDAHLLALVHRAMPGARIVLVERDPRDALLNWLAFGWARGFPCSDVDGAAEWLVRARRHLHHGDTLAAPRRLVVAADALLEDPAGAGDALARFLGLGALEPGAQFASMTRSLGGLPVRFPAGHWQRYRDALAAPFARLAG